MVRYVLGYPGKYGAVKLSERSKSEGGFASDCTLIPAKLSVDLAQTANWKNDSRRQTDDSLTHNGS